MPPEDSPASETMLLCVDMQPIFLKSIGEGGRLLRRCAFAIAAARGLGFQIAFTEQIPAKLGNTAPELTSLAAGAPIWDKSAFSALGDARIRDEIRDRKPREILVCGLETSVCVYQTAVGAASEGYQVTVFGDCVGARRPDDASAALHALERKGIGVLPSETFFYAHLRDAGHPFFRSYTKLVKDFG
jgi:nicotinamidase-related amidase